jgi:DNA-binding transcriptional LysR family regulator
VADLRRLEYFVAVARERNFTRAAERLRIAQPALSRQVRLLEEELGVELMHRTTHAFELTEAGEFLLERGPALLAAADELWRGVRTYGSGELGGVVLGYGASASYETGPRLLARLAERHPGITITTSVKLAPEIIAGVRDGSIDLGLVRCPPHAVELEARPVRAERQVLLLRRDHPLAAHPSVAISDLADEAVLMHPREANPGHYDAVVELCPQRGLEPRILLRAMTFDLRYGPIRGGEAVAIVGESATSGLPTDLAWVSIDPPACLEISLIARRHGRSAAVTRLLDSAEAVAQDLCWL